MESETDLGTENITAVDAAGSAGSAPEPARTPAAERTFTQSDVNRIAAATREKTRSEYYERGKRDALAAQTQTAAPEVPVNNVPPQQQQNLGGMTQLTPQEIDERVKAQIYQMSHEEKAMNILKDFAGKVTTAKDKYSDFDAKVSRLNLAQNHHLITWTNELPNTTDTLYELGEHPDKLAHILILSQSAPEAAKDALKKLSASISKNEDAKAAQKHVPAPLGQVRHSTAGTADSGDTMGMRSLKAQPWLKG